MRRTTIDDLRAALPELGELRPLLDSLISRSEPDPGRTWSASGQLGTASDRLLRAENVVGHAEEIAEREHRHRLRTYRLVASAVEALAAGDDAAAAQALLEAAGLEEERDDAGRALAYADAAVRLAMRTSQAPLISVALRRRGRYRRACGRLDEALRDYDDAFTAADALGDPRSAAEALVGAGNVLEEQAHWDGAAQRYGQALEILAALADPTPELWHAQLNLHVVLFRTAAALEECLEPLRHAERTAEILGDASAAQFLENAKGQHRMARGDFEGAERHLRRGVEVATGARAEVTIRLNLAEALLAMGRTLDAAEEARRAERKAIVSRLWQKLPEVYRLLGRVATADGLSDSFVLFERALDIIGERDLPAFERAQTLQAYAEAERSIGDADTARELLAEADRLYATLGIERRQPWTDRFDVEATPSDPTTPGSEDG